MAFFGTAQYRLVKAISYPNSDVVINPGSFNHTVDIKDYRVVTAPTVNDTGCTFGEIISPNVVVTQCSGSIVDNSVWTLTSFSISDGHGRLFSVSGDRLTYQYVEGYVLPLGLTVTLNITEKIHERRYMNKVVFDYTSGTFGEVSNDTYLYDDLESSYVSNSFNFIGLSSFFAFSCTLSHSHLGSESPLACFFSLSEIMWQKRILQPS